MKRNQARFTLANRRNLSKIRLEMEKYELFSLQSKECNVLQWWKQHENVLPLLARLARRVLVIPASSAKSERVFSSAGNAVTAKRNRTAPNKVQSKTKRKFKHSGETQGKKLVRACACAIGVFQTRWYHYNH